MHLVGATWGVATIDHGDRRMYGRVLENRGEKLTDDEAPSAMLAEMRRCRALLPGKGAQIVCGWEHRGDGVYAVGESLRTFVADAHARDWLFAPFEDDGARCEVYVGHFSRQKCLRPESPEFLAAFAPVIRAWFDFGSDLQILKDERDVFESLCSHGDEPMAIVNSRLEVLFKNDRMRSLRKQSFEITTRDASVLGTSETHRLPAITLVRLLARKVTEAGSMHDWRKPLVLPVYTLGGARFAAVANRIGPATGSLERPAAAVVFRPSRFDLDQAVSAVRAQYGLSPRQCEIVSLVSTGMTNLSIAQVLGINLLTVKKHLYMTYKKLGVSNRTAVAARVLCPTQLKD